MKNKRKRKRKKKVNLEATGKKKETITQRIKKATAVSFELSPAEAIDPGISVP